LISSEVQRLFAKLKHSSLVKRGKSKTSFSRCFSATHEPMPALPVTIQVNGPRSCSSGSGIENFLNETTSSTIIQTRFPELRVYS
jgi:hypothetical protein